jgi:type I restriction enzyme S subunit
MTVETVRLKDLVRVHYGKALKKADRDEAGAHAVFGSNGEVGKHSDHLVDYPTLIIGRKGSVGSVTYAPDGGWPIDTAFYVERLKPGELDLRYLFYALGQCHLEDRVITTSIPGLGRDDIYAARIPLPPLPEQRQIAAILDKVDTVRRKRQQTLDLADQFLHSAFLDIANRHKGEMRTIELSEAACDEKHSFVNGPFGSDLLKSELHDDGVPVIYIRDIRDGVYRRVSTACVSIEKAAQLESCRVMAGDILIAKVGSPPGTAAIYPNGEPDAIVTQDVIRIRPAVGTITPDFLVAYLNSQLGKHRMRSITVEATRSRFPLGAFKKMSIEIPSIGAQQEFTKLLTKTRRMEMQLRCEAGNAKRLADCLVQRAFREEL